MSQVATKSPELDIHFGAPTPTTREAVQGGDTLSDPLTRDALNDPLASRQGSVAGSGQVGEFNAREARLDAGYIRIRERMKPFGGAELRGYAHTLLQTADAIKGPELSTLVYYQRTDKEFLTTSAKFLLVEAARWFDYEARDAVGGPPDINLIRSQSREVRRLERLFRRIAGSATLDRKLKDQYAELASRASTVRDDYLALIHNLKVR